jgi:glutaredoxin-related protein
MDVDTRDDVEVLAPILTRLTGFPELPILLISGKPVGSMTQIREMLASGELQRLIKASGAVIGGGKRRKHKK